MTRPLPPTGAHVFTPSPGSTVYLAPLGPDGVEPQWQPIGMVADDAVAHLVSDHASGTAVDLASPVTFSVDMLDVDEATLRTMGLLPERAPWWRWAWGELLDRAVYWRGRFACVVLGRHGGPICAGRTDHRPHVPTWGDRLRQRLGLGAVGAVMAWWLLRRWFGW